MEWREKALTTKNREMISPKSWSVQKILFNRLKHWVLVLRIAFYAKTKTLKNCYKFLAFITTMQTTGRDRVFSKCVFDRIAISDV